MISSRRILSSGLCTAGILATGLFAATAHSCRLPPLSHHHCQQSVLSLSSSSSSLLAAAVQTCASVSNQHANIPPGCRKMSTMRAIVVDAPGDVSKLRLDPAVSRPQPKESEILVKVRAFGLNRMDILQREGKYPPPPGASELLGVEVSGVVESVGSNVTEFKAGDRVFGLMGGGGYAEYAVMNAGLAMRVPPHLTFEQAASIPEAYFTAFQALHLITELKEGQSILVHAGASGVGAAAIQLAKLAQARQIFATAGAPEKIEFCKSLGADVGINYKTEKFQQVISEATSGRGVNVIIDFVGADYWEDNLASLSMDGRMVILAFLGGVHIPNANIGPILRKRLRIEGSTLRSRPLEYQINLRNRFCELLPHFESGTLKPTIDSVFPWTEIKQAHVRMESNKNLGKIIVTID